MPKYRLYDIAKELSVSNKDLMDRLEAMSIVAKSHSSTISEVEYDRVMASFKASRAMAQEADAAKQRAASQPPRSHSGASPQRSSGPGDPDRPMRRLRPDGQPEGERRLRPNSENMAPGERRLRPRPEGMPEGEARPRPIQYDADGNPIPRRRRRKPRVNAEGFRIKPDGTLIMDADGKPVRGDVPRPRPVDSEGRPIRPDGTPRPPRPVDSEGRPIRPDGTPRPPRPVDSEGRPIRPDGTPRPPRPVDSEGRPIRPDGTPRPPRPVDSEGRPIRPDGTPRLPRPVDSEGRPIRPDGTPRPPRPVDSEGRPIRPDGTPRPPRPVDSEGRPIRPDGTPRPPRPVDSEGRPIRSDQPRTDSQRRPYGDRQGQGQGQSRPYGDRQSQGQGQSRPYGDRQGQGQGQSRPYGDRQGQGQGQSRPYGDRQGQGQGQSRPYGDRQSQGQGQSRPYGDRQGQGQGQSRPYGDRQGQGQGQSRPYGDRQGQSQGQSRPYGDRQGQGQGQSRPYGDRQGQGQGQSRPYGDRQGQGQGQGRTFPPRTGGAAGGAAGGGRFGRPAQTYDKTGGRAKTGAQEAPNKSERQQNLEAKKTYKKEKTIVDKDGGKTNKTTQVKTPGRSARPAARAASLEPKTIVIPSVLTLKELAEKMTISGAELVKSLLKKGQIIGINNEITYELAADIALNYNVIAEEQVEVDIFEDVFGHGEEDESLKSWRPPVVVVMGHVDHGKTSLLDAIRHTSVTQGEHGGITQHIGAYMTSINDKPITFLDTPGHEAFTAMRMRGAQVTDIAILVVAADDGVMPQTIEAISHAKAAGVEIIVAINKMDKASANPDRVKQELTEYGLVTEEWGGETICVPVSATKMTGIDQLLEMIILVAEMKELKANANKRARGVIIEALLDKGRGPVATVLVQEGTLNIGDPIVAGTTYGKVRAMIDDKGKRVKKAGPSTPVEILGLPDVPNAGDMFYVAVSEKQARAVAETYYAKGRHEMTKAQSQKVSLDDLFSQIQAGKVKDLNIIIKADVQGSVEALRQSLEKLSSNEVRVKIILGNVGAVTESDVTLASASNAIIIGFNVRPEVSAKSMAEEQKVDIRLYRVIYSAIEDIQSAMKGLLDPVFEEKLLGRAEVRQTFKASGIGTIGGAYILDGKFVRNASVRILRDNVVVYEGGLESLRRFKDDVREVAAGYECGLVFERFNDLKTGDIVEAFVMEEIKR